MVPFVHETKGVLTNFIILYINYTPKIDITLTIKYDKNHIHKKNN